MNIGIVKSRGLSAYRLYDILKIGKYDIYWHSGGKGLGVYTWGGKTFCITVGIFTLVIERLP